MASRSKEHYFESDPLVEVRHTRPKTFVEKKNVKSVLLLLLIVLAVLILALGVGLGVGLGRENPPLYKSIKVSNLMQHLQELENIAMNHPSGSRAVQYAYNESAEMVYDKLIEAGYEDVFRQDFTVGIYEDLGNSSFSATVPGIDYTFDFLKFSQYSLLRYSGSTDGQVVTGGLDAIEESGCNVAHYTPGTVALVNYNTNVTSVGCSLFEIAEAAESAGVVALVMARMEDDVFNDSPPTARIFLQTVNNFTVVDLPLLGATYQLGKMLRDFLDLSDEGTVEITVITHTSVTMWDTYNILAYTSEGREDSIIVVGSHLDSVPAGPGINDNGSGSSGNLEMALQVVRQELKPVNKVLFAFWGAEELGLLGSIHFVKEMIEEGDIKNIALNLNFDMIGSPNFIRQIYNGSGAENQEIVGASEKIQNLFEDHFKLQELDYQFAPFNGRSDYGPFIEEGVDIPAGGLATGFDEIKTSDERSIFGGFAGAILDPCYHQYCDTLDNINKEVIEQTTQAAASVLETLMMMEDLRGFLNSTTT